MSQHSSRLRRAVAAAALGAAVVTTVMPAMAVAAPARHASTAAVPAGTRAYLVITAPNDTAGAKTAIAGNGGTVFASYDAIGVIVAHSTSSTFAATMRAVAGVQKVGATRTTDVPAEADNPAIPALPAESTPTGTEPVRADMSQIGADRAWAVNQGSSGVTVGVLDTGVDDQHFDLKANFDATRSASCAYGKLDTRVGSWRPVQEHGTHVAGTIAAAKNGKGMVGVAPGVHIASVRIAEPQGQNLFFPENTVCAFVFAGDKGFKVTNSSYYTDPWLFNCPSNLDQDAILEGVKRAVAYADGHGVLNVAAAGNENYNLANKTTDTTSPDDSTPTTRTVTNACLSVPTELPGVVEVAAITGTNGKSSYSNFGTGKISIAAPGDNVYSTLPGGTYGSLSGTSMASPHVAGTAALLASVFPTATPADLRTKLAAQADDLACPSDARCTGTTANNSFFGEGRVDAFQAVSTGGNTVTVNPPGNQTGTVGTPASLQVTATDSASGQTLTYSATGLPTGLVINATTGLISGTPTAAGSYGVTVTARDTTQASGSAIFTWTVNPSGGGGCSGQLLANPGFESGTASWTQSSGVIGQYGSSGQPTHGGTWNAWLNGYGTTHTDTLSQSVTVPAGCHATLTFWLHIDSAETSTTTQFDKLTVKAGSTTLGSYSNLNKAAGYAQKTFDLSAFAGQTVTILFTGTEDSSLQTSFVLDDLAVAVS